MPYKYPNKYYVYVYCDPTKKGKFSYPNLDICFLFEPFYIGMGKRNRMYSHLKPQNLIKNSPKIGKIKKLMKLNYLPIIFKLEESFDKLFIIDKEIFYITNIGRRVVIKDGPLMNIMGGGEGTYDYPEEYKKKLSINAKQRYLNSDVTRKKISESKKKKIPVEIQKEILNLYQTINPLKFNYWSFKDIAYYLLNTYDFSIDYRVVRQFIKDKNIYRGQNFNYLISYDVYTDIKNYINTCCSPRKTRRYLLEKYKLDLNEHTILNIINNYESYHINKELNSDITLLWKKLEGLSIRPSDKIINKKIGANHHNSLNYKGVSNGTTNI